MHYNSLKIRIRKKWEEETAAWAHEKKKAAAYMSDIRHFITVV